MSKRAFSTANQQNVFPFLWSHFHNALAKAPHFVFWWLGLYKRHACDYMGVVHPLMQVNKLRCRSFAKQRLLDNLHWISHPPSYSSVWLAIQLAIPCSATMALGRTPGPLAVGGADAQC